MSGSTKRKRVDPLMFFLEKEAVWFKVGLLLRKGDAPEDHI